MRNSSLKNILLSTTFSHHNRCYWCEFPVPDCCCAVSKTHANDNFERKTA